MTTHPHPAPLADVLRRCSSELIEAARGTASGVAERTWIDLAAEARQAAEREEARSALLDRVADGLGTVHWPDETGESGREWCSELNSYLRGQAGAALFLPPDDMRALEAIQSARLSPLPPPPKGAAP